MIDVVDEETCCFCTRVIRQKDPIVIEAMGIAARSVFHRGCAKRFFTILERDLNEMGIDFIPNHKED